MRINKHLDFNTNEFLYKNSSINEFLYKKKVIPQNEFLWFLFRYLQPKDHNFQDKLPTKDMNKKKFKKSHTILSKPFLIIPTSLAQAQRNTSAQVNWQTHPEQCCCLMRPVLCWPLWAGSSIRVSPLVLTDSETEDTDLTSFQVHVQW